MSENKTIEILKLRSVTIAGYDVETSFVEITIYESLSLPMISGNITIRDYQGLQEIGNIFAGDDLEIAVYVDNDEANEVILKLKIISNEGSRQLSLNTYDILRLEFASPWWVEAVGRTISKPYKDKFIHEIVEDLLTKECSAEIGIIEPTKHKLESFVTPWWTPYHSIKYFKQFALSEQDQGGYVLWTDFKTGKVNFTTLDYLLRGNLGKYKSFLVYTDNNRYSGRVIGMNIEQNYDLIRMLNNGMGNSRFYIFNYDKKKIYKTENDVTKTKLSRLGSKFPLDKKYMEPKYINHNYSSFFPKTKAPLTDDDKIKEIADGIEKTNYAYMTVDTIKINIETLGEMKRRVGWIAELKYPSAGANAGETGDKTGHKQYAGWYLIREIRHEIDMKKDYTQIVTLVGDGFKEFDLPEMIDWDKADVRV